MPEIDNTDYVVTALAYAAALDEIESAYLPLATELDECEALFVRAVVDPKYRKGLAILLRRDVTNFVADGRVSSLAAQSLRTARITLRDLAKWCITTPPMDPGLVAALTGKDPTE